MVIATLGANRNAVDRLCYYGWMQSDIKQLPLTLFAAVVLIALAGGIFGFMIGVTFGQREAQSARIFSLQPSPTATPSPTIEPPSPTPPQATATAGLRNRVFVH